MLCALSLFLHELHNQNHLVVIHRTTLKLAYTILYLILKATSLVASNTSVALEMITLTVFELFYNDKPRCFNSNLKNVIMSSPIPTIALLLDIELDFSKYQLMICLPCWSLR